MLLTQLLRAEAAEIVTIQSNNIKLQNTNAKENTNTGRPFVYCFCSLQTLLPMASHIRLPSSQQSRDSPSSPLTPLLSETPAGRAAFPCLGELNPHSICFHGVPALKPTWQNQILLLPADVVFPIFLSVLSIPYIVNTCGGEEKRILFFYVGKEMRAKRAVSVLLLLLLLLLREGWSGFFFSVQTSSNLYLCS